MEMTINAADPHPRRRLRVLDTEISYVDTGHGDPVVFLHGNLTSSYVWRNIIRHISGLARCLAPHLVGMGRSGKSPREAYRFTDHATYLDGWFDALGLTKDVFLIVHDWGSALGFHRAFRHPEHIRAIVHMESIALHDTLLHTNGRARNFNFMIARPTPGGRRRPGQPSKLDPAKLRPLLAAGAVDTKIAQALSQDRFQLEAKAPGTIC